MLLRALDPLVDYHQIDHALVNFGVNMRHLPRSSKPRRWKLHSRETWVLPQVHSNFQFQFHFIRPPDFASQKELRKGRKRNLHSIKLVRKALKNPKIQMWRSWNGERMLLGVVIIHVYVAPEAWRKSAQRGLQILEKSKSKLCDKKPRYYLPS